jgi:hypothetical protein
MGIDLLKIRMTITAAEHAIDKLEQAIDEKDYRRIGAELYNARRELSYLKQLTDDKPAKPSHQDHHPRQE